MILGIHNSTIKILHYFKCYGQNSKSGKPQKCPVKMSQFGFFTEKSSWDQCIFFKTSVFINNNNKIKIFTMKCITMCVPLYTSIQNS